MYIESISSFPLLSLVVLMPALGAILLTLIPREQVALVRNAAIGIVTVTFLVSLRIWSGFDGQLAGFQLVDSFVWSEALGSSFTLGVDGISLWLVLLSTFLSPIILLSTTHSIVKHQKEFYISYLLLETGMLGALLALDLLVFYVFWEFMLIPMYLIIGVWGGKARIYATVKFILYTMLGSLLMLVAIIMLYIKGGSESFHLIHILNAVTLEPDEQTWYFLAFALAFAVKIPMFPFHTWLPDAHVEAPTAGSVVLAGVLLKLGTYGFLRFAIPLFPAAAGTFSVPILVLAIIGIIYGALVAFAQKDIKKLVAYSSVSHLGFVMLGLIVLNRSSLEGSILQMVNHGISTGALFLMVGMIYERRHTRMISDFGGLAKVIPAFSAIFLIVTLSSIGLPGTNGFIGEFLILAGTFRQGVLSSMSGTYEPGVTQELIAWGVYGFLIAILATIPYGFQKAGQYKIATYLGGLVAILALAGIFVVHPHLVSGVNFLRSWHFFLMAMGIFAGFGIILGAVYMLSMYRRVIFGPITDPKNQDLNDLSIREWAVMGPLVALIFIIGLCPNIFLSEMQGTVDHYVETYQPQLTLMRDPESYIKMRNQEARRKVSEAVPAAVERPTEIVDTLIRTHDPFDPQVALATETPPPVNRDAHQRRSEP